MTKPAPAVAVPPNPVAGPTAALLILVLGTCGFASTFAMRLVDPIVPLLAQDLARTVEEVAVLSSAYAFAYAFGQPILGSLGDALGKTATIRGCCLFAGFGSLLCAVATSYDFLLLARFLAGMTAGGIIPLSMAAIGDRVPLSERQTALSRLMLVTLIGQFAGAAASGTIADAFGWRAVFAITAALAFAAAAIVTVRLKPGGGARRPLSVAGAVAGYRSVLANGRALPLYAIVFSEGVFVQGMNPFAAAILKARNGVGATEAGFIIGASGLGGIAFAVFAPVILRIMRPRVMVRSGGLVIGLGYALFAAPALPWWMSPLFFFLIGFGFFLLHNNLQTQATELSQSHRGSAMAMFAASFFLGQACGPLLFGAVIPAYGPTAALTAAACAIAALGLVAARVLRL